MYVCMYVYSIVKFIKQTRIKISRLVFYSSRIPIKFLKDVTPLQNKEKLLLLLRNLGFVLVFQNMYACL